MGSLRHGGREIVIVSLSDVGRERLLAQRFHENLHWAISGGASCGEAPQSLAKNLGLRETSCVRECSEEAQLASIERNPYRFINFQTSRLLHLMSLLPERRQCQCNSIIGDGARQPQAFPHEISRML